MKKRVWCPECGRRFHTLQECIDHQDRDRCGILPLEYAFDRNHPTVRCHR